MYGPLILGVCLFAIVLGLRIAAWRQRPMWSSPKQHAKLARVLVVAILAFLAIAMRLNWTIGDLDGKPREPMSWWEKFLDRY